MTALFDGIGSLAVLCLALIVGRLGRRMTVVEARVDASVECVTELMTEREQRKAHDALLLAAAAGNLPPKSF